MDPILQKREQNEKKFRIGWMGKRLLITKDILRTKLLQYINREITLAELIDWAENTICEGEFQESQSELLRDILGRIGLADVKEFGLTWDDCYEFLKRLGYQITVEATKLAS